MLREAHADAVQKAVAAFNATAVGGGSTRQKYEKRFQTFIKKAFEVILTMFIYSWICVILVPNIRGMETRSCLSFFSLVCLYDLRFKSDMLIEFYKWHVKLIEYC